MARKKKHEEHVNAEAWAIPYGDLVTLLFALFTVMYSVSSVNEGKFRILSDSIIAAFNGAPRSMRPINIGEKDPGKGGEKQLTGIAPTVLFKIDEPNKTGKSGPPLPDPTQAEALDSAQAHGVLNQMQRAVEDSMRELIDAKLVTVRRADMWLEIQINADILFESGAGDFSPPAEPVLDKLAEDLRPFPNPIRVEGHTDDRPIKTAAFPSNWELSAARAASVVHQFTRQGVDPMRLEIVGFGEFHPRQPNDTVEGRNANRRVVVLVLEQAASGPPPPLDETVPATALPDAPAPATAPPTAPAGAQAIAPAAAPATAPAALAAAPGPHRPPIEQSIRIEPHP